MNMTAMIAAGCLVAGMTFFGAAQAVETSSAKAIVMAQSLNVEVNGSPRVRSRTVIRRHAVDHRGPRADRTVMVRRDRGLADGTGAAAMARAGRQLSKEANGHDTQPDRYS